MLISEISPIDKMGTNLLERIDAEDAIEEIIELPLRKACVAFRKKGIKTLMSSANKNNVLHQGEEPKEKENLYKTKDGDTIISPVMFDEAGKGYAWIMLDFNSLSDENKDWLFKLEERKDKNNVRIGEKGVWFVQPCEIQNLEYGLKVGKYDYESLKQEVPENKMPKNVRYDKRLAEFYKRHIVLAYNWAMYSLQTVILRMPVNEQTTVEEVEQYFTQLAESFKEQVKQKEQEER